MESKISGPNSAFRTRTRTASASALQTCTTAWVWQSDRQHMSSYGGDRRRGGTKATQQDQGRAARAAAAVSKDAAHVLIGKTNLCQGCRDLFGPSHVVNKLLQHERACFQQHCKFLRPATTRDETADRAEARQARRQDNGFCGLCALDDEDPRELGPLRVRECRPTLAPAATPQRAGRRGLFRRSTRAHTFVCSCLISRVRMAEYRETSTSLMRLTASRNLRRPSRGQCSYFRGGKGGGGGVRGGALLCSGQHRGHDLKLLHGRKAPQLPPKPKRSAYLQAHILVSRQPTPARSGVGDQRPGKATLYTKHITESELYGCSEESDMCTQQYKLLKCPI